MKKYIKNSIKNKIMENNIARRLIWKIYGLNVIQTKFKWLDEIDGILLKKA